MHTNRLIDEKSPYLLQHAHNPVDWRPWGAEAFEAAKERNQPIFLSIGYSTCHWCHVMERESFENESIAAILNENFICIKVDREERPDVDRIYMTYVQATTGGGGWPMSVWLTPDLRPFVGGTYFPPEDRYGRPGFATALQRISEAWERDRERIVTSSEDVLQALQKETQIAPAAGILVSAETLDSGFYGFRRLFDTRRGGFGGAPKFPRPVTHNFLLRYYARTGNREALDMVVDTLRAMAKGGMNDQLGGGFHRYSVDANWFVPHFEKMLYDQAQLAISYLEAFQITGESGLADTARAIFDYLLRDMLDAEGGFYSAEDADSVIDPAHPHEKGEGAFYVWTQAEIERVLGQPAAKAFCHLFGVERNGNVHEDPHQEFVGKNILFQAHEPEEEMAASIAQWKQKLLAERSKRVRPHLDDKVLTAWNGLAISAFAKGGAVLAEPRYGVAAKRAADFILAKMYDPETGALLRRYRQQDAAIPGFLDDYAFFTQGLLDLYEAYFHLPCLEAAIRLTEKQIELFEDKAGGAFFSTAGGDSSIVMRLKDDYDGAEPSGNSIATMNLLRLAEMTGRRDFREAATGVLRAFAQKAGTAQVTMPQMLAVYEFSLSKPKQIVLVSGAGLDALLREMNARFLPHKIVFAITDEAAPHTLSAQFPAIERMTAIDGGATAYVCEDYACQLPTADPRIFAKLLQTP
jgi:uncharacterized protein YyaL (SSP411 family)